MSYKKPPKNQKPAKKFELTEEVLKKLQETTGTLPQFAKVDKRGNMLYDKIGPGMRVPRYINHYQNLCDDYQTHGWPGVNNYINEVILMKARSQAQFASAAAEHKN